MQLYQHNNFWGAARPQKLRRRLFFCCLYMFLRVFLLQNRSHTSKHISIDPCVQIIFFSHLMFLVCGCIYFYIDTYIYMYTCILTENKICEVIDVVRYVYIYICRFRRVFVVRFQKKISLMYTTCLSSV